MHPFSLSEAAQYNNNPSCWVAIKHNSIHVNLPCFLEKLSLISTLVINDIFDIHLISGTRYLVCFLAREDIMICICCCVHVLVHYIRQWCSVVFPILSYWCIDYTAFSFCLLYGRVLGITAVELITGSACDLITSSAWVIIVLLIDLIDF